MEYAKVNKKSEAAVLNPSNSVRGPLRWVGGDGDEMSEGREVESNAMWRSEVSLRLFCVGIVLA